MCDGLPDNKTSYQTLDKEKEPSIPKEKEMTSARVMGNAGNTSESGLGSNPTLPEGLFHNSIP